TISSVSIRTLDVDSCGLSGVEGDSKVSLAEGDDWIEVDDCDNAEVILSLDLSSSVNFS
ncbi:6687_t:CDS:2, partial [Funneliformis geosporum]